MTNQQPDESQNLPRTDEAMRSGLREGTRAFDAILVVLGAIVLLYGIAVWMHRQAIGVPWFLGVLLLIWLMIFGARRRASRLAREEDRRAGGRCRHCGYPLSELPSDACPECGSVPSGSGADL